MSLRRYIKGSNDYFALNHYTSTYVSAAQLNPANSYLGRPQSWRESPTDQSGHAIGPVSSLEWLRSVRRCKLDPDLKAPGFKGSTY